MPESEKFDYLPQLIKRTRLAHIKAEKRLLALDSLAKHATVYYACWTAVLTLATLYFDCDWLPYISASSAVVVALFTAYASCQNYGVRAEHMKASYIALQDLWLEFDAAGISEDQRGSFADSASKRYVAILRQTENHSSQDDLASNSDTDKMIACIKWAILRTVIYLVPFIVVGTLILTEP